MNEQECGGSTQKFKTFSPAEALRSLSAEFFDEKACRIWILKQLHPDGAHCPACGAVIESEVMIKNFWELKRCQCSKCGKWFTATAGTILQGVQLNMRQVFLLALLLTFGRCDKEIASVLKISSASVRLWRMRFSMADIHSVIVKKNFRWE